MASHRLRAMGYNTEFTGAVTVEPPLNKQVTALYPPD